MGSHKEAAEWDPQPHCRTRGSPHSPVQVLVQGLVRILVALNASHEVFRGLITIVVHIVRAAQFHLLPDQAQSKDTSGLEARQGQRPRKMLARG